MSRLMKEKGIFSRIKYCEKFTAKRNENNNFEVTFAYMKTPGYMLQSKVGGVRQFLRLNGVQKWMEKMGVEQFKVIL